ncbi:hypothetical protein PMAYCL1PPCAC_00463, partial [Pristionchus mayeri]
VFNELVKRIDEKPCLHCGFCDRVMFTARQIFMHMASAEHSSKVHPDLLIFNNTLIQIVGAERVELMFKQEA